MKYDKKDMMNEGWGSMAKMLDNEMPQEKKDRSFLWMFLFVLIAFGSGLTLGQYLESYKIAKAKKVAHLPAIDLNAEHAITSINDFKRLDINAVPAFANEKIQETTVSEIFTVLNPTTIVLSKPNQSELKTSDFSAINKEEKVSQVLSQDKSKQSKLIDPISQSSNELNSDEVALNYFLITDNKVKKPRKWGTSLTLASGINLGTQTKVGSAKGELLYQIGKENAIGFELMVTAEDEVYFFRNQPLELDASETRFAPDSEAVSDGKEPTKVYNRTTIPRQFKYGAGLVLSQGIGYKFYTNLSAGVDLLKNTYTSDDMPDEDVYRWGAYSSVSAGYHLNKHIDFEVSGTKSWSLTNTEGFVPGRINHLVAGLKFSF